MTVAITGANSAIGQAILRRASKEGALASFIAAVRSSRAEEQIRTRVGAVEGVARISFADPSSLDAAFREASSIIHLAGVLVEQPNSTYEQANVESTRSVVEAAKRNRVQRLVLVSALGADENSSNRYYRTKGHAESLVRASGLRYSILRVPIVLGPGTAGAATLARNVQGGRAKLIDGGRILQQPLHVDDLARAAVLVATHLSVGENSILEFVGPCLVRERELVERAARSLGRTIRIRSIPKPLLSLALAIREGLGKPGFSRDALEVVTTETHVDPQPAARELGIELTGIDQMIKDSLCRGPRND